MSAAFRKTQADVTHPDHGNVDAYGQPAFPDRARGWAGVKARRACWRRGGHWWHPADAMILWRCCACGAVKDGMPVDGSRSHEWLW